MGLSTGSTAKPLNTSEAYFPFVTEYQLHPPLEDVHNGLAFMDA